MTEQHISSTNLIHYLYGQNDSEPVDAMSVILQMNQNREKSDSSQQDAPTAGNPLLSLQRFVEETPTDDSDVLPYSLSSFPTEFGLCKSGIPGATFGVYAKVMIPLGTWIGPYEGKVSVPQAEEDQDDQLWEVFVGGSVTLMMNSQDINRGNWMRYIQPARHIREQNLEMVQHERSIYYHVMQDLEPGTELLVWYGDQYTLYMGIPLHQSGSMDSRYQPTGRIMEPKREGMQRRQSTGTNYNIETISLERSQRAARFSQSEAWKCGQCFRTFSQRSSLQMHVCDTSASRPFLCGYCCCSFAVPEELKNHVASHAAEKPFKCGFCHRAFAGSTTLSNHMRTHTNSRPFRCHQCGTDFTQGIQYSRHIRVGECSGARQQEESVEGGVEEQEEDQETAIVASPDEKQEISHSEQNFPAE